MSQASAQSSSGSVYYADPNAAQSNWILWGVVGAVALVLILVIGKR